MRDEEDGFGARSDGNVTTARNHGWTYIPGKAVHLSQYARYILQYNTRMKELENGRYVYNACTRTYMYVLAFVVFHTWYNRMIDTGRLFLVANENN